MPTLIVTNRPKDWPAEMIGVQVVDARTYLTDPAFNESRGIKVFNLCHSYRYQSSGYYVSLLAEARGHKPIPSIATIQDLKTQAIVRLVSDELDELIQRSLAPIKSDKFTLSIYFGTNLARRYDRLESAAVQPVSDSLVACQLHTRPAELAAAQHHGHCGQRGPRVTSGVSDRHRRGCILPADACGTRRRVRPRFDLAILYNPTDPEPPSDEKALRKFIRAAAQLGISAELITRDDYGRLAEFDALFIRDTTYVNRYTWRFARRAAGEGLVVIDDPQSIVRCTNKVYLAELLARHKIATPATMVVHRDNASQIPEELGFPCVLKKPDSAFSQGVVKVDDEDQLDTLPRGISFQIRTADRPTVPAHDLRLAHRHS